MLRCREITLLASDYVDGRLRWRKRLAIVFHLLMCGHCRRFVRQFRVMIHVIRGMPRTTPPPDYQRMEAVVDEALREHGERHGHNRGE